MILFGGESVQENHGAGARLGEQVGAGDHQEIHAATTRRRRRNGARSNGARDKGQGSRPQVNTARRQPPESLVFSYPTQMLRETDEDYEHAKLNNAMGRGSASFSAHGEPLPAAVSTLEEIIVRFGREKRNGKRVVFTNGCFDLLHPGHIHSLETARGMGDALIVGINSDESVRALKGPGRPLIPEKERAEILASLECVDGCGDFSMNLPPRE